jgi:hypothetical protein
MHRALIVYDMDVYGALSPHDWQYIDQNTIRHKSSQGTKVASSLRFGAGPGNGTATGTGIVALSTDRFDTSFKDSVICLAEKMTPLRDEEAQSHEVLSILPP